MVQDFRHHNAFAQAVTASLGERHPFRLLSVGLDNGDIERGWRSFGEAMSTLVVARTAEQGQAAAASAPGTLAVAVADFPENPTLWDNPPFPRFNDARARYMRDDVSAGQPLEPLDEWVRRQAAPAKTQRPVDLDYAVAYAGGQSPMLAAIDAAGFGGADFMRLDGGWADYSLLLSLGPLLERPRLQGVYVKLRLHGSHAADENTFHNIDRFMRQKGFELFRMDPVHYSSSALPWPFLDRHPDQSESGRALLGKALYVKDLAGPPGDQPDADRAASIVKAAAIRALFNMPDQAAELLVLYRNSLEGLIDVDAGLDLLALQIQADQGTQLSYRDYIAEFERGSPRFYNLYEQQAKWLDWLRTSSREALARTAAIQDQMGLMTVKLRALERRLAPAPRKRWFGKAEAPAFDGQAERDRLTKRSVAYPQHHWIFDCFGPWHGMLTEPAVIDFIGSKTSVEVGRFKPEPADVHLQAGLPHFDEEYFEWTDVLEAVLDAGETFTMLELGAGYGRWSVRAALAARKLGKAVSLGLAEAEPKHVAWLQHHMHRNGVEPASYRIFPVAVAGTAGEVVFAVGSVDGAPTANWFGQAVVAEDVRQDERVGDYYGRPLYEIGMWKVITVPQAPMSEVLEPYGFVDLIDMDIQGSEADALAEAIGPVTRKVRRLHIGTHDHDIEEKLRDLLSAHGWVCLQDFACHTTQDTPYGPVSFVDGVQSWINPMLWNRP